MSNNEKLNVNQSSKVDEAVIIYRSWYICLLALGPIKFGKAMIALLSYAFFGADIHTFGLSPQVESILYTFTPVIESNRRKRVNGAKGAAYGHFGGRPRNPSGVSVETPNGTGNLTTNGKESVSADDNVAVAGTRMPSTVNSSSNPPHTDPLFFLKVFFFRNLRHPIKQAEKFTTHYMATEWRLSGGDYVGTDEARIALAMKWDVKDDTTGRFKEEDLVMWHKLYDLAPEDLQLDMLGDDIEFHKGDTNTMSVIKCPTSVQGWIEAEKIKTFPIVRAWMSPCSKLQYINPNHG